MTTKVTVIACCDENTEVMVGTGSVGNDTADKVTMLQNGETQDFYVYDEQMVAVIEQPKGETKDV